MSFINDHTLRKNITTTDCLNESYLYNIVIAIQSWNDRFDQHIWANWRCLVAVTEIGW